MKKSKLIIFLLIMAVLFSACQPTPKAQVVIGKNEGVLQSALGSQSSVTAGKPYEAPGNLKTDITGLPNNYTIKIDAEVDVSKQKAWPVYSVEPAKITQDQADTVRVALLGDTVLYKPSKTRSRAEIQKSIDYYEKELKDAAGDDSYKDLIDSYKKILKDLYAEYAKSPENLEMEKADTNLAFMEDQAEPRIDLYGGNEVKTNDGGMRYEWTDDARKKAITAGCENIYGVCWTDKGRKLKFSVSNGSGRSYLNYEIEDGNVINDPGVTCSLDDAASQADALLKKAGLDFTLVGSSAWMNYDDNGNRLESKRYYTLKYKRNIDGVPADGILSCIDQNIDEKDYRSLIPEQETITIQIDDYGVRSFSWNSPMKITATETANVPLIPFEQISSRVESQLKIQTVWDKDADTEAKWIDSRRLEINKIVLSYLMAAKSDDMSSYYLIPVWNVCGNMYFHYTDSYPTGKSDTYILDKNHERNVWRARGETADYSILTINAVDGSVMPRLKWH